MYSGLTQYVDSLVYALALKLSHSSLWLKFWAGVSFLGSGILVTSVLFWVMAWSCLENRNRRYLLGLVIVGGVFIVHMILKEVFDISRPLVFGSFYAQPITKSFPSGHSVDGVILFYFIPRFIKLFILKGRLHLFFSSRVKSLCVTSTGISLVALSRIFLGVHWLTDIAGGIVWGIAVSSLGLGILQKMVGER